MVFVTAYDAAQFCSWLGRRLPTAAEWERAARGQVQDAVPLGQCGAGAGPGQRRVNHLPHGLVPAVSPAFARGQSKEGIEQLIGNAAEWTETLVRYIHNGPQFVQQGTWNGRDRVKALAVMGGGWQEHADAE